jgi:hypothetical protein
MFPDLTVTETTAPETTSLGKSFLFDFSAGEFVQKDGNVVEVQGKDALKVRIIKAIKTEKNKFDIYEEYGSSTQDLISNGYPRLLIESELKREISETLLKNVEISGVMGFSFERSSRGLAVKFTVESIYGSIESEVIF